MKNNIFMKKILPITLSAAMLIGTGTTAFAADGESTEETVVEETQDTPAPVEEGSGEAEEQISGETVSDADTAQSAGTEEQKESADNGGQKTDTSAAQTYTLTAMQSSNGTFKVSGEITAIDKGNSTKKTYKAAEGTTITVTVTPSDDYELDKLTVKGDTSGKSCKLTDKGSNVYTFTMPSENATVKATYKEETKTASVLMGSTDLTEEEKMEQTAKEMGMTVDEYLAYLDSIYDLTKTITDRDAYIDDEGEDELNAVEEKADEALEDLVEASENGESAKKLMKEATASASLFSAVTDAAYITVGRKIPYNGYSTNAFTVSTSAGSFNAMCAQAGMATPSGGPYSISELSGTDGQIIKMLLIMAFGSQSMDLTGHRNNIFNDMTGDDMLAMVHATISYAYSRDLTGLPSDMQAAIVNCYSAVAYIYNNYYASDPTLNNFHVYAALTGSTTQDIVWMEENVAKGYLQVYKTSSLQLVTEDNSHYCDMSGAVFGVYPTAACNTTALAELVTDENGFTNISGELTAGTTYWIAEWTSPDNYYLNPDAVASATQVTLVEGTADNPMVITIQNNPIVDPVALLLTKVDAETGERVQGAGSLAGAEYEVKYYDTDSKEATDEMEPKYSWVFKTNENGYFRYDEIHKVSGDDLLYDTSGNAMLPLGIVTIQEIKAPEGYVLNDTIYKVEINQENGVITDNFPTDENAQNEQPVRGDLKFVKISEKTGRTLAGVPFSITSKTTGESHVVVTDEDGLIDTSSSHNKHSSNTNRGETSADGIWFGDTEKISESKGAMLYDDYVVEELPCEANYGMELVTFEVSITENGVTVDKGEIKDLTIGIGTTASSDVTGIQTVPVDGEQKVIDTVAYDSLEAGRSYTMKGKIVNRSTKETVAEGSTSFTPEKSEGTVKVEYTIDSEKLAGNDFVIYEYLFEGETERAKHEDPDDEDQFVYVPEIRTTAIDSGTEDEVGTAIGTVTLIDTVHYTALAPGETYTVYGTLMDQESGEEILINGEPVTSSTEFTPETQDGDVEVAFTFDIEDLPVRTVVVFESLEYDDIELAVHADIDDESQTVYYPEIGTSAEDSRTEDKIATVDEKTTLIDTVTYENLVPGKEYTVSGTLMDQETGEEILIDGKAITAETTFTPEEADGEVEVEFVFDGTALAGKTTVVFEDLIHNGKKVAVHADIEDEGQTVHIPEIHTTATDGDTKEHVGTCKEKATITDVVAYTNLIIGKEYTVKGKLMDKDSGEPMLDADKKEITSEVTFTAEKADGTVELVYTLDSSLLAGHTAVIFEDLYYKDVNVYSHSDLTDEDQSVYYPEIHTNATVNGSNQTTASGSTTLIDKITYKNLVPGKEYTVKGVLMDKSTGKELTVNGSTVTSSATFTPEKSEGTVSVKFTFSSSALGGKTVVVFEDLYRSSVKIATHSDINDSAQSVVINSTTSKSSSVKTGDGSAPALYIVMAFVAAAALGLAIVMRKRVRAK